MGQDLWRNGAAQLQFYSTGAWHLKGKKNETDSTPVSTACRTITSVTHT
jgi:hypothetical protein